MVFIIFLRKGSVRHGIYFEGSAREKRLRNAALEGCYILFVVLGCEANNYYSTFEGVVKLELKSIFILFPANYNHKKICFYL